MLYSWLKLIHQATILISIAGFVGRGILMMRGSRLLQHPAVRIVPHVNDTILLLSALGLATLLSSWPFQQSWLTAKLIGLVVYIVFGSLALKRGKNRTTRTVFWLLALATFAYIVSVALTRNPLGFLSGIT